MYRFRLNPLSAAYKCGYYIVFLLGSFVHGLEPRWLTYAVFTYSIQLKTVFKSATRALKQGDPAGQ
jgi:hypothetical protein